MNDFIDNFTSVIKRALDIVFVKNPAGTAMGVLAGIVLYGLTQLFMPSLKQLSFLDPSALNIGYFISLGIFIFNIKPVIFDGHKYEPEVEKLLEQVKKAERDKLITKATAKKQYSAIISKYVMYFAIKKKSLSNSKAEQ